MKTIKFAAYLFYRYYSTGVTKDIAYFSTLCAIVMILGLHIFQILILFGRVTLIPTSNKNSRLENYFTIGLWLIPVFLLVALLIKKADLQKLNYEEAKIENGNIFLVLYVIASIALLLILILIKQGKL